MTEFCIIEFTKRIDITYLSVLKQTIETLPKTKMCHGIHITFVQLDNFSPMTIA